MTLTRIPRSSLHASQVSWGKFLSSPIANVYSHKQKNLQSAKFNLCIYCLSSLLVTNQEALYKFSSLEVFKRLLTFSLTVLENYHGTAIESPVSVFVAEIVLKNIDKCALSTRRKGCNHGYATLTIHTIVHQNGIISRVSQPYKIRIAHRPNKTLHHSINNVKNKEESNNR